MKASCYICERFSRSFRHDPVCEHSCYKNFVCNRNVCKRCHKGRKIWHKQQKRMNIWPLCSA